MSETGSWSFERPGLGNPGKDLGQMHRPVEKTPAGWRTVKQIWNSDNPPLTNPAPAGPPARQ